MLVVEHSQDHPGLGRRHAAVLFVDLSGFTALVETAAPETVYNLVRPIMDDLVDVIQRHGGAIQQVLGDGFMSVFGLEPHIGQGSAAAHAVRAAVALLRSDGGHIRLPVHVGIEAGEVLLSRSWEPARFGVWGRAVTVASRLCDAAAAGAVHVGPNAFEHGGRQVLELLDDMIAMSRVRVRMRGIAEEVVAYRLTSAGPGGRPSPDLVTSGSRTLR